VIEPPEAVQQWFVDAGWCPGRFVEVPPSVPTGHPAWDILAAFGGLVILERDPEPDPDWPPIEELVFRDLFPCPAVTEVWGQLLDTRLVGIANVHNDHGELYIASDGRCFGSSSIHPAFYYHGESFTEAVEGMLLGRRARPLLRPDQPFVALYGERFTADSPELYRYK
jgi:SUKH-3 immunity protein